MKGFEALKGLEEQENTEAQSELGSFYYKMLDENDAEELIRWYQKAKKKEYSGAAERIEKMKKTGYEPTAQELFLMALESDDRDKATEYYHRSAEMGYAMAQYHLGCCYCVGDGVPMDYAKAVRWFRKAAEQGLAVGQNNLGECYYCGRGVPQDYGEAVKWFRKAAEQGLAVAQYNLGFCYEHGQGVPKNKNEAEKWYRKAAEQGYAPAVERLKKGF